ncbi:MAG: hypothetical protein HUK40_13175 [Desulfobacter sp.]|nr:hypothetical protein [Desulfobacter sp.]
MDADDEITVARDIMADLAEGPDEAEAPKAGLLKRFFQAAGRIIKSIFTRPNSEPRFHDLPENIKLQHPSGREITLSSKALPPIPLGTSLEDFTAGIQDKINRDGELVNTILDGDIDDRQCGPKEMTDIMWFMHTATETKVGET